MSMTKDELFEILASGLPDADIKIEDLAGDGDHYAATIISKEFIGLNRIQQHKLVYDTLGEKMGYTLHALSIKTELPKD
ncbi:BolA family transcriptional regulator [Hyphomicrobiales bacterium]|nr:BolA family transcriptional regulator [Hyphomicrobiales bacterium]|tara:strand:+ start:12181 stop:12417 length:237 start_codon:yes stop_codon:yes gene_type:complete